MASPPDRTIHASNYNFEVVRYDLAGRWFVEVSDEAGFKPYDEIETFAGHIALTGNLRCQVQLVEAVDFARFHGLKHHRGRVGGTQFDRLMRLTPEGKAVKKRRRRKRKEMT